jgi:hypothetical protein
MEWTDGFRYVVAFDNARARAYVNRLRKAPDYSQPKPIYLLTLADATFWPKTPDFFHEYQVFEEGTEHEVEGLRWFLVELPKFRPSGETERRYFDAWLRYLTEVNEYAETIPADLLEIPETRKAIEVLDKGAYSNAEIATYIKYWDSVSYERTLFEDKFEEGVIYGLTKRLSKFFIAILSTDGEMNSTTYFAKTIEEGVENGIERGVKKSRKEYVLKAVRQGIAEQLKKSNIPPTDIARVTDISLVEITVVP